MIKPSDYQPFWFSEALAQEQNPVANPLCTNISVDVCIVGGGYTGLWTALQLKIQQPNINIAIIDKGLCGSGASGRNGGCMLSWSTKYLSMKRLYGEQEACRLIRASEDALFHIRDFCLAHNIDAHIRLDGALYTATNQTQLGTLDPTIAQLKTQGMDHWQHYSASQAQKASGSMRNLAGYFSPISGSLQPGLLVRGLKRVAQSMGVQIYEDTPMQSMAEGSPTIVTTPTGNITTNKLVLAINAWTPSIIPALKNSVILVSSDMLITEPVPDLMANAGLDNGLSVLDSRTFVHYYRTTLDGRLMLGKGGNVFAFNNRVYASFDQPSQYQNQLCIALKRFFPYLADTPIERTWTGPSDRSKTGMPFFGYLNNQANIVYGLGYSGSGVGQSYIGGQILASMVLELDNEWRHCGLVSGPIGQFPPEPIRWLGAMTVRNAVRRNENAEDENNNPLWIDKQLAKLANGVSRYDKS